MRSSPRRRTRSGEPPGSGSSLASAAGIQYWRTSLSMGVPGATRQSSSLSSRLSMASLHRRDRRHALMHDRVGDGLLERLRRLPFARRTHVTVAADLVDAPVDLDVVALGIPELDGELAARAAP